MCSDQVPSPASSATRILQENTVGCHRSLRLPLTDILCGLHEALKRGKVDLIFAIWSLVYHSAVIGSLTCTLARWEAGPAGCCGWEAASAAAASRSVTAGMPRVPTCSHHHSVLELIPRMISQRGDNTNNVVFTFP